MEVEEPALLPADVRPGISLHGDGEVDAPVHVVQHGLHQGRAALEEEVLGIGAPQAGPQEHAAADAHRHAVDEDPVARGIRGVGVRRIPPGGLGSEHGLLVEEFQELPRVLRLVRSVRAGDLAQGAYGSVQPFQHLGGHRLRQVDHRGGPRVRAARFAFLLVGQGRGAQGEDLVDLGGVVHRSDALGCDGRMVLQDDRRGEYDVRPARLAREDRPGVPVDAGGDGALGPLRRVGHRQEGSAAQAEQEVGGDERARQRRLPVAAVGGRGPGARVLHHGGELQHPVGSVEFDGTQPYAALDGFGTQYEAADDSPVGAGDRLDFLPGRTLEGDHRPVARQLHKFHAQFDALLDPFVPGHQYPVVEVQFGHLFEGAVGKRALDGAPSGVQEAQLRAEGGFTLGFHQDLGLLEGVFVLYPAPCGRHEHPELPAQPVLGRGGPVGVQHVPLEEDRVGHLPGVGEPGFQCGGRRHGAVLSVTRGRTAPSRKEGAGSGRGPAAASRRVRTVASQEASACRDRKASSSSMRSRGSRSQPQPGKCCSTISRQTATGIRYGASRSQGTGSTWNPWPR